MATVVYQIYASSVGSGIQIGSLQIIRPGILRQALVCASALGGAGAGAVLIEAVWNASGQVFANVNDPTRLAIIAGANLTLGNAVYTSVIASPILINRAVATGDILSANQVLVGVAPASCITRWLFYVDER